jgi:hypothetical protein
MPREVLLTGSVPREPASAVFRLAEEYLRPHTLRLPDGEQGGWGAGSVARSNEHPQLQPGPRARMTTAGTPFGRFPELTMLRLADGIASDDFSFPRAGVAELKLDSYRQFRDLKAAGEIPPHIRFQATIPGPGTAGGTLYMPLDVGVRAVGRAQAEEIERLVDEIPHDELTIQLDLAVEVEAVELQRRPDAFDMPIFNVMFEGWGDWRFEDMVEEVVRVARAVPNDVELGFHLCGCWHIDPAGGQDIGVHVDWANALTEQLERPVGYFHMPTIPEHSGEDFAPLAKLELAPETDLFLGLIHSRDGLEGARRRVQDASRYTDHFGVAHFCGMNAEFNVKPAELDELFDLHARVAEM